ncbi:uncharacterized protein LOC135142222 [Zophobas morio]|uniref:uncharacterized protein LOC135142222 n=1 Tax=Zophobas morio TaxID=2755281 RepID=UPI003083A94D
MGRKCVVPKCKSGLKSCLEKVSLFSIPKNKLEIWQKALPTKGRQLTYRDCVCMKHFRESDIIREVKTDVFTYQLQVPKLAPNAIPCKFPILSNYQLRPRSQGKCISKKEKQPDAVSTKANKKPAVNAKPKRGMTPEQAFKWKLQNLRLLHKDPRNLTQEKYNHLIRSVTTANPKTCSPPKNYNVKIVNGVQKLVTADRILFYIHDDELFKVLYNTHIKLEHATTCTMMTELKKTYTNIVRRDVAIFRKSCPICKRKSQWIPRPSRKKKPERETIVYSDLSRRCSVNILNYDGTSVMIYQNKETKFCLLSCLQSDTPEEVAQNLVDAFTIVGVSEEIESSIGSQFWRDVATELKNIWTDFKLRHFMKTEPAIIGDVHRTINEWMENNSTKWVENLHIIQLQLNRELNDDIETTPYDAIYGLSEPQSQDGENEENRPDIIFVSESTVEDTIKIEEDQIVEEFEQKVEDAKDPLAQDEQLTFNPGEPVPEQNAIKIEVVEDDTNPSGICMGCGTTSLESKECRNCLKKRIVKNLLPQCYTNWKDVNNLEEYFTTKLNLSRQTYHSSRTLTKQEYDELVIAVEEGKNYHILLNYQVIEREGIKRLVKTEMREHTVKHYVHDDELFYVFHYTHINLKHAWRERMASELKKRFANIVTRDIMTYLNACTQCQRKRLYNKSDREPLIYSNISAHCSINFIDYHLRSDGGYKYVLVYQNHLTKFYMLKALFSLKPAEVAYNLIDIFTFVGVPTTIGSKEDWTLIEDIIRQLKFVWEDLEVEHLKNDAYEGTRVIDEDIRTWLEENKTVRWTKGLRFVQLARNQEYHSDIEGAPYDALFGVTNTPDDDCESEEYMDTKNSTLQLLTELFPSLHKKFPPLKDNVLEELFLSKLKENRSSSSTNYLSKQNYYELLYQVTAAKVTKQTDILKKYGAIFFEGAERLILPSAQGEMMLYVHDDDLFTILHYVHTGLQHMGTKKMNEYLKSRFVNISPGDIWTYCQLCPVCMKRVRHKLKSDHMACSLMSSKCSIDIINFYFCPDNEFKYIMVYQNNLTRFCVFKPMKTRTPEEVADNVVDVLTLMGTCKVIQSREGAEFVQKMIRLIQNVWVDFSAKYGGIGTCAVDDIGDEIKSWIVVHDSSEWSKILPSVQLAWNKSIQQSRGRTPYEDTFQLI